MKSKKIEIKQGNSLKIIVIAKFSHIIVGKIFQNFNIFSKNHIEQRMAQNLQHIRKVFFVNIGDGL